MNQRKFVVSVAAYALFSLFSPFVANGACHLNEIEHNCTLESTCKSVVLEEQTLYACSSPDGKIKLELCKSEQGDFTYLVKMNDAILITHSKIGYALQNGSTIPAKNWKVTKQETRSVNNVWKPLWGKREVVNDCFNELSLTIAGDSKSAVKELSLLIRLYNEGVAFKYQLPQAEPNSSVLLNEVTEFNFAKDFTAWFYNFEYHNIGPEKLTESNGERLPVMTVKADEDKYLAIHEAYLQGGLPLLLESNKGETLFKVKTGEQQFLAGEESAWRVILMGRTAGSLVDSHLIELLNPEPDPSIDFTWVKPGVSLWDWRIDGAIVDDFTYTMTYPSWVKMIDFAAQQGFDYLVLDANWYGPEHESESDPIKGDKANDVQRILQYAKTKNVGVWLYLNDVGGRQYPIENTLKQYSEWGAAGVKYGFMQGTLAEKNLWTKKITELCAQNKLLINFHDGPIHPYGQMRTWPNALTREYCHAQLDAHRVFQPKTFVTSVFVNMLAGPIDMNNGMFDLRQGNTTRVDESTPVPSTVVSEAARTLITFSGATILPDIPEFYKKYPELLQFISAQKMPWKESRTLSGEIGEYIVMMRQTEDAYLIGAATNENERDLTISLSFLPKGNFELLLIQDGKEAHYLTNRETYQKEVSTVTAADNVRVHLAAGGGACLLIKSSDTNKE